MTKIDTTDGSGGGTAQSPSTTVTPGCPATPDPAGICTQEGQVCTWTTGSSSATYTCKSVMECTGMTYIEWADPVMKGDGCAGSASCVACSAATPGDPCDALGFTCPYMDPMPVFPPSSAVVCQKHAWSIVPVCEN